MAKEHWIVAAADELLAELLETAESVAAQLAPPEDAYDGRTVARAQYVAHARAMSLTDPTYLQRDLDRMAPPSIPFPDGTMGRSLTGLRNFNAKWKEARPDLYAAATLAQPPPAGAPHAPGAS